MSGDENCPVISMSSSTGLGISIDEVKSFTTNMLESSDPFFVSLRKALVTKGFDPIELCLIWMVPFAENAEDCTIYHKNGAMYDFAFEPDEISNWTDSTTDPESAEYLALGREYFNLNGS